MNGPNNFSILATNSGYNSALIYYCSSVWWTLWTSVYEGFEVWGKTTTLSSAAVDEMETKITGFDSSYNTTLHSHWVTQGDRCYG